MDILAVLEDTCLDTIKLIPFLFITYIVLEWIEHKASDKMVHGIENANRFGPFIGSLFGLFPQCGFSSIASSLYETRIITLGTLIAIFLSTSDEMLPILISRSIPTSTILEILSIKFVIGILAGYGIDLVFKKKDKVNIEKFCEEEHCDCEDGILKSAIIHTLKIVAYIFFITLVFNFLFESIGTDTIKEFIASNTVLSIFTTTLVGLIPNCAPSIIISELYISHIIPFSSMIAGLLANTGVGLLILFRINRDMKENLMVVGLLALISICCGLLFSLL